MNQDFVDLLRSFAEADVRCLVVGAYALAHHVWPEREPGRFGELTVDFLGRAAFLPNKRATGRAKDLADIESLS